MDDKNNIIKTFTELAPKYEEVVNSELSLIWGWSYQRFVETFLTHVPLRRGDTVLDLATGTGVIPAILIDNGTSEKHIHGLDITYSMLVRVKPRLLAKGRKVNVNLVCASAMDIPYAKQSFDVITCALATHHMDAEKLVSECHRILKGEGCLSIADVGASRFWLLPGIKTIARAAAFLFFLFRETINRAWAEAGAISKIRTVDEWSEILQESGFRDIKITKLTSKYFWIPEPHIIIARK
ncbi:MAG: class I SAM-dependent methyltransferase [Anaerolineales bacterium]|jgi:ubiquinone/menaquinone biosynthesis C-methylase UbiE